MTKLLSNNFFAADDLLFEEGEMSESIYFIRKGLADIFHSSTLSSFAELGVGENFGEIAFFSE